LVIGALIALALLLAIMLLFAWHLAALA
jgi:hypothetical protein